MDTFNIELKNFQSISGADLEFKPGINLIVGQSNSGKTAIIRAVNAVINNPTRGKYYIKKGTKNAKVSVQFDGNNIDWERTNSDSTYNINNELFKKTGRNTLFDLLENTGFVRDDDNNVMNIEGEWDLPFPFDRTPSELFRLFENIFCISDSAVILKSFKDEEANIVKERLSQEDKLARQTKKLEALNELREQVNTPKYAKKLEIFGKNCDKYKDLLEDLEKIYKSERFMQLKLDEVVPPIDESLNKYIEAVKDYKFLVKVIQRQKFYKSLPASVIIGDTIEKYEQAQVDYDHVVHAQSLKKIDLSKDCEVSSSTMDKYIELSDDYKDLIKLYKIAKLDLSKTCDVKNTIDDYETMLQDYKMIVKCHEKCKALKEQYLAIEDKLNKAHEKLHKFKVCPLCGHELDGD